MFNPFRKSKTAQPAAASKPAVESRSAASVAEPSEGPKGDRPFDKTQGRRIIGVIMPPHLTEKTSRAQARGWYTFRVRPDANKLLVKQAVEERYAVTVEQVHILAARRRRMRLGRIEGQVPGFKKAMVKVKAGQSIEFT